MKILGKLLQQKLYSGLKGFFCIPKLKLLISENRIRNLRTGRRFVQNHRKLVRLPHASVHGLDQVEQI